MEKEKFFMKMDSGIREIGYLISLMVKAMKRKLMELNLRENLKTG